MQSNDQISTGSHYPVSILPKKETLPHSLSALIFGIVSLATMACFGWIMAIVALNQASKALLLADQDPGRFSEGSLRMANAGRKMGVIGLVLGILGIFVWILYILFIVFIVTKASHHSCHY